MFSNRKVERVRFRWTFLTPQSLNANAEVKYQSLLQEVQFDCQKKDYRLYTVEWYDAAGKVVASENKKETEEFQEIKFGSMMDKFFPQACKLIERRKQEPAQEQ